MRAVLTRNPGRSACQTAESATGQTPPQLIIFHGK